MDAIVTNDAVKTYRVGVGRARIREALPFPFDRAVSRLFPTWWRKNTFNAVDGITLSIPPASSVGLVGHNGAGKTTLLKVIAGVTEPTSGRVQVNGRIAALLDVLVGFHPELTGRENIYLLGAIQKYGRTAMRERIDRILEFADIGEQADTPLKRFSAGMITRLGFATITALDVDVLLIDEVLAVGDAGFQRKCVGWLEEYRGAGGTLVFVSHNLALVRNMTERVVWIDHGEVRDDGPTEEVLAAYGRSMEQRHLGQRNAYGQVKKLLKARGQHRWGIGGARVEEVHVGEPSRNGEGISIGISYESTALEEAVFCVAFIDEAGHEVAATASPPVPVDGRGAISCAIRPLPLRSGIYFPVVGILSTDGQIRDRWQLDRAVVVDRDQAAHEDGFAPVGIASNWAETSEADLGH